MRPKQRKYRILLVYSARLRFIDIDAGILGGRHKVERMYIPSIWKINLCHMFLRVRQNDLVMCWFSSWHAFWPIVFSRMLGRPSVLIIGGYDTARMPEIKYGNQTVFYKRWITNWNIRHASFLNTFSHFSQAEAAANANISPERISVLHLAVPDLFQRQPDRERKKTVMTVGSVWGLHRKGMLPFVQAARYLKNFEFVHVGKIYNQSAFRVLQSHAPDNVTFLGFVDDSELASLYQKASVYCQLSAHEGFGLSLAEAMLGGCVPVVTRAGAIPEVTGKHAFYTQAADPRRIADTIQKASSVDDAFRRKIRKHILTHFPMTRREKGMLALIDFVMNDPAGGHAP